LAAAGHHRALRLASGAELTAERTGVALGLAREVSCSGSAHRLAHGDGVLLYTDGLTEARGEQTRYGIERLSALLRQRAQLAPQDTLEMSRAICANSRASGSPTTCASSSSRSESRRGSEAPATIATAPAPADHQPG
jgi:hypothetical protein